MHREVRRPRTALAVPMNRMLQQPSLAKDYAKGKGVKSSMTFCVVNRSAISSCEIGVHNVESHLVLPLPRNGSKNSLKQAEAIFTDSFGRFWASWSGPRRDSAKRLSWFRENDSLASIRTAQGRCARAICLRALLVTKVSPEPLMVAPSQHCRYCRRWNLASVRRSGDVESLFKNVCQLIVLCFAHALRTFKIGITAKMRFEVLHPHQRTCPRGLN